MNQTGRTASRQRLLGLIARAAALLTVTVATCFTATETRGHTGPIIDLGPFAEYVVVTPEYSNAVLRALLPRIDDTARKLDLPLPHPLNPSHVLHCSVSSGRRVGAEIVVRGGWAFSFRHGYFDTIQGPNEFFTMQDLDRIPDFFGEVKMPKAEAIQLARDTLRKLDIPLESVFAEQEPRVTGPLPNGTNTIPRYLIEWLSPYGGDLSIAASMDIDGNERTVTRIKLSSSGLDRNDPDVGVVPPRDPRSYIWSKVNPDYAFRLLPVALRAVDEYGEKLLLKLPRPLTTNQIAFFSAYDNGGWPHCEIELTNGWRFTYRNTMVNGFYSPHGLFSSGNRPILVKDFLGQWRISQAQAEDLVRRAIARLNPPTNLVHFDVEVHVTKPNLPGIPRYLLTWDFVQNDDLQSSISAEVDADKGELTSLYYDDKAYWNKRPDLGVPFSAPPQPATNSPPPTPPAPAPRPPRQPPRNLLREPVPLQK